MTPARNDLGIPQAGTVLSRASGPAYIPSLDTLRVLAMLAIICLHTDPFHPAQMNSPHLWSGGLALLVNGFSRFGVPFFFIASGYLFGQRAKGSGTPSARWGRMFARAGWGYAFWCSIYAVTPQLGQVASLGPAAAVQARLAEVAASLAASPVDFLLKGTERHLWFLPALIVSSGLVAGMARTGLSRLVIPVGAVLFLIGLSGQGYARLSPIAWTALDSRDGPFFGTILFGLGWATAGKPHLGLRSALALIFCGLAMQWGEILALRNAYNAPVANYYLGTIPLAYGMLHAALARPRLGGATFLPGLGRLTLGVYGVHILAIRVLFKAGGLFDRGALWQVVFPLLVYGLSALVALAGSRVPGLKRCFA